MPYTQAEEELGVVVSVQTDADGTFQVVPQTPNVLEVNLNFLQYHAQGYGNPRVDNPRDDMLYLVALVNGQLVIEPVPLG